MVSGSSSFCAVIALFDVIVIAVGVKSIVTFPITEIQILDEKSRP
jgi:hypothetical protein